VSDESPPPPDGALPEAPRGDASVADLLYREGYRFDFFQVVRLLERLNPDRTPVGRNGPPEDEVARFRSHVSMGFPASELWDVAAPAPGSPAAVTVTFMGLTGAVGALPPHYTSILLEPGARKQVAALRDFLDLFNHRLLSLFYRAWEKYRFPVAFERGGDDIFSHYLLCLVGMGLPSLRHRLRIPDQILVYYAGLLSQRPRTAVALEGILEDYFGVPVQVQQFTGAWFLMNAEALTRIGVDGRNHQLGVDASLWERVWDPQARFRVKVGPLTYQQFQDFLPTSEAYRHLVELTRFYVGEEISFDIQPTLKASEVPWCALGQTRTSHLGWGMWLKTEPFAQDTTQPILPGRLARLEAENVPDDLWGSPGLSSVPLSGFSGDTRS
jgi:type VI secretion system protein ImpH